MSHAKNVAAYGKLISCCTGLGGKYKPGHPNLQLDALNALLADAKQALENVRVAKSNLDNETNAREIEFSNLPKVASSILFSLAASGATKQTLDDARVFLRQITGRKLKERVPIPSDQTESIVRRSHTQLSYVSKADHFSKMVKVAGSTPAYQPNEPELQVEALNILVAKLQDMNARVARAEVEWSNARIERTKNFYSQDSSILTTMRGVKNYVRAIHGVRSEQYQQLKALRFIQPPV